MTSSKWTCPNCGNHERVADDERGGPCGVCGWPNYHDTCLICEARLTPPQDEYTRLGFCGGACQQAQEDLIWACDVILMLLHAKTHLPADVAQQGVERARQIRARYEMVVIKEV